MTKPPKRADPFTAAAAIVQKIRGTYQMHREEVIKAEISIYGAVLVNNAIRDLIAAVESEARKGSK